MRLARTVGTKWEWEPRKPGRKRKHKKREKQKQNTKTQQEIQRLGYEEKVGLEKLPT
jgi:hypothetical protein